MNKFLLIILILSVNAGFSQNKKNETIESLFLKLPVFGSYEQLINSINTNKFFRIDSAIGKNVIYATIRNEDAKYLFPDSIDVKLIIRRRVFIDSATRQTLDTSTTISLSQYSNTAASALKERDEFYKAMTRQFRKFFANTREINLTKEHRKSFAYLFFSENYNNFPEVSVIKGFDTKTNQYYVRMVYDKRKLYQLWPPVIKSIRISSF